MPEPHVYTFHYLYTSTHCMRTNIELDDILVKQAIKLSKLKTKKEVVHEALKSYVASLKKKELLALRGHVSWEGNLKEMRSL